MPTLASARRALPLLAAAAVLVLVLGLGISAGAGAGPRAGKPRLDWRPHFAFANEYVRHRQGVISYAVIGANGFYHGRRAGRGVPMASTIKVMLLATYLRRRSVRHRPLHRSERKLLGPMIRRSDNAAATRVRDIVGRRAIERLANDARMRDFRYSPSWGLSRTSARDQAHFMDRLERYLPARHRRYARRLLATIVPSQRWGVARVSLHGWKLFFKGGWGIGTGAVDHQIAFLGGRGYRIALAIMTTANPSHTYGKQTLKGVARRLLWGLPRVRRR